MTTIEREGGQPTEQIDIMAAKYFWQYTDEKVDILAAKTYGQYFDDAATF